MLDEIWVDNAPSVAQFKQQYTTSALARVASLIVKPVEARNLMLTCICHYWYHSSYCRILDLYDSCAWNTCCFYSYNNNNYILTCLPFCVLSRCINRHLQISLDKSLRIWIIWLILQTAQLGRKEAFEKEMKVSKRRLTPFRHTQQYTGVY